jgi:hypothetical protein
MTPVLLSIIVNMFLATQAQVPVPPSFTKLFDPVN